MRGERIFNGLVIGGPMDGQRLSHYAPEYVCPQLVEHMPPLPKVLPHMSYIDTHYTRYQHRGIRFEDGERVYFWRAHDVTDNDTLERLFTFYNDHARRINGKP